MLGIDDFIDGFSPLPIWISKSHISVELIQQVMRNTGRKRVWLIFVLDSGPAKTAAGEQGILVVRREPNKIPLPIELNQPVHNGYNTDRQIE